MDKPLSCISNAAPNTTNNAAAVITSRALAAAKILNNGLSNQCPATINPAMANSPMPIPCKSIDELSAA